MKPSSRHPTQRNPLITIFGSFRPDGAIQDTLRKMIDCWLKWGCNIEVVSFRDGELFHPARSKKIKHIPLGTRHRLTTTLALGNYIRRRKPEVVLSCTHIANTILAGTGAIFPTRSRKILSIHQDFIRSEKNKLRPHKTARKEAEIRKLYPKSDGIITVSKGIKDNISSIRGLENTELTSIYNGIITKEIYNLANLRPHHPWFAPERNTKIIVSAGRLSEQKDHRTLIIAFASAAAKNKEARLIILGEGEQREGLEALAEDLGVKDLVDMPGHKANPHPYVAQADLFVLSSRWEGLGNVLIEALALGTPIVSTDCPSGPREILEDGRYGILVPPRDPDALAEGILKGLRGEAPKYDPAEAVDRFRAERAARAYLDFMGITPPVSPS